MGKKAVVLGGGGSRGSYQVGVWKALRELDFDYKIVTGTSVGALNGALMVQNDYELAQKMWQKLKTRDVMDVAVTDKIEGRKDLTSKVSAFISEIVKNGGAEEPGNKPGDGNDTPTGDATPLVPLAVTAVLCFGAIALMQKKRRD